MTRVCFFRAGCVEKGKTTQDFLFHFWKLVFHLLNFIILNFLGSFISVHLCKMFSVACLGLFLVYFYFLSVQVGNFGIRGSYAGCSLLMLLFPLTKLLVLLHISINLSLIP